MDDECVDDPDCSPPAASHGRLPLDVWHSCHQQIPGEAGDFDAVAVDRDHVVGSDHDDADDRVDADGRADADVDADANA